MAERLFKSAADVEKLSAKNRAAQNTRSSGSGAEGAGGDTIRGADDPKAPGNSKYRNRKTIVDNVTFDSEKEAARYGELKLLLAAGEITDLKMQRPVACVVNLEHVCDYISDFSYYCRKRKTIIWEDAKGYRTEVYRLKKKLVRACTGIEIQDV